MTSSAGIPLLSPGEPEPLILEDVLVKAPLYTEYSLEAYPKLRDQLAFFDKPLDVYCQGCGRHSVFKRANTGGLDPQGKRGGFHVRFDCSRDHEHQILVAFSRLNNTLQKMGQSPSVADLADADSLKYAKMLGKEKLGEFRRATGLAAHGVGVGSFVYLRRIFEGLITEAYTTARAAGTWDEVAWQQARMDDKILLLKDQLPDFLVAQRSIYGILSRGVHELSEQECLAHFEVVKAAIEVILDAKLEQEAQAEKKAKVEKLMQAARQALAK